MSKKGEWLPWYRRKDYRGNLTEEEKRFLDGFHQSDKHPATTYDELPEEGQRYIVELEQSVYDAKQSSAAHTFFILASVGALLIYSAYRDLLWVSPLVGYLSGVAAMVIGWFLYARQWKKTADEYIPKATLPGAPFDPTEEGLQRHYEMLALGRRRQAIRAKTRGQDGH